jgi:hypothetical protein
MLDTNIPTLPHYNGLFEVDWNCYPFYSYECS